MPSVDDLEQRLVAFVRAFGLHQTERTPCGEPISVSQGHALSELSAQPLTQAELARRLRLDRSVVSRLADALEAREWLRRARHPHDQRAVQLVLTERGHAAAARLAGARRARLATLLDGVPSEERANVLRALEVLTNSLIREAGTPQAQAGRSSTHGDAEARPRRAPIRRRPKSDIA
jgi:DNA-binding MarR family transcriptional regulator